MLISKLYGSYPLAEADGLQDITNVDSTPQPAGEYALIASRHEKESGVFRVNLRDGAMSICYVLNDRTVCTPPGK